MVYGNVLDEKLYKRTQEYIRTKKLNIELIGNVAKDNIQEFYDSLNFLVLTSRKDPLPTVILEAFNSAVPVIGHNVDGVSEMIEEEYNGFLFSSNEEFVKIAKKLNHDLDYRKLQYNANVTVKEKFNNLEKINNLEMVLFNV